MGRVLATPAYTAAMPVIGLRSIRVLLTGLLLAGAASGCGAGSVQTIGFGTGGSQCTLANDASSFAVGVPVQFVAVFTPELPAGDTVTITLSQDDKELTDMSGTVKLDAAQNCIGGGWRTLTAGHYGVVLSSQADTGMPPLAGEFDVTP